MALIDRINQIIHTKFQLHTTYTVNLYNGSTIPYKGQHIRQHQNGKKHIFYYQTTFGLMQQCAANLRIFKESFQCSLLTNSSSSAFLLPYCKFIPLAENNGKYNFRLLHHHLDLDDLLSCDSEAFQYIYYQAKADFFWLLKTTELLIKSSDYVVSLYGILLAELLKRMNLKCTYGNLERLLRLLEVPNNLFVKQNVRKIVGKAEYYCQKYKTCNELKYSFIKDVNNNNGCKMQPYPVSITIENNKLPKETYYNALVLLSYQNIKIASEKTIVMTIEYEQITKITTDKSKPFNIEIHLHDTLIKISFLSDCRSVLTSCIALIDLYFRHHVKARVLVEPTSAPNFDSFAISFNELNQSQTSTNIYNIIEKSMLPLSFISTRQGQKILKDLGLHVGWYIVYKERSPQVYGACIVLNSGANGEKKIRYMRILNKDGRFMIDEARKKNKNAGQGGEHDMVPYKSLEELMKGIKIIVGNKQLTIRPSQIVTEEMVTDIRKGMVMCDSDVHKQSQILSLFCLHLIPNSYIKKPLCDLYTGHWVSPGPEGKKKDIRAFVYNKKYLEKDSLHTIAKLSEISRPEFVHENILKCYGYADDGKDALFYVHELFGLEFSDSFALVPEFSDTQLFDFGRQIKNALQFLHDRDIVHGFPALQNVYINKTFKQVKLGKIGVLSAIMHRPEVQRSDEGSSCTSTFLLPAKYPVAVLNTILSGWFSQRRIRMLYDYPDEKCQETWDRYVFGCTLWQLYNKGAIPLSDKSDQEILDKLEGKDSWFNGGTYFRLPRAGTEFLNKLQKIINVCVTWGNKDNLEKYEFSKIADAYEKLGDVVNIEDKTSSDFILKAENGKLDFNVNITDSGNNKYTLVEEDNNTQVILVRNKKSPPDLPPPNVSGGQFNQVRDMLKDEDKLLQLSDLQGPEGGKFVIPAPGDPEREAVCSKVVINKKVWVKSYSKCKNVPEQDFLAEVKNLLTFKHPNIVPLRGCVILPEVLLLITPSYSYCNSLRGYINNKHHAITDKKRESYALQICTGMKYLAEHKCVHRNLRLSHVYLTNYNEVVITNFGLARVTEGLYYQQQRILSSDTFVIYPPEVISVLCGDGKVKFNSGCDVWSYGVLLWELYSSEVAYNNVVMDLHGNPDINLLDGFFRDGESLQIDPGWPDKIRKVITKCLSEEQSRVTFSGIEEILVE